MNEIERKGDVFAISELAEWFLEGKRCKLEEFRGFGVLCRSESLGEYLRGLL